MSYGTFYCTMTSLQRVIYVRAHRSVSIRLPSPRALIRQSYITGKSAQNIYRSVFDRWWIDAMFMLSVATAGFFPLDLGFFGVVWVSGYFCQ